MWILQYKLNTSKVHAGWLPRLKGRSSLICATKFTLVKHSTSRANMHWTSLYWCCMVPNIRDTLLVSLLVCVVFGLVQSQCEISTCLHCRNSLLIWIEFLNLSVSICAIKHHIQPLSITYLCCFETPNICVTTLKIYLYLFVLDHVLNILSKTVKFGNKNHDQVVEITKQ